MFTYLSVKHAELDYSRFIKTAESLAVEHTVMKQFLTEVIVQKIPLEDHFREIAYPIKCTIESSYKEVGTLLALKAERCLSSS